MFRDIWSKNGHRLTIYTHEIYRVLNTNVQYFLPNASPGVLYLTDVAKDEDTIEITFGSASSIGVEIKPLSGFIEAVLTTLQADLTYNIDPQTQQNISIMNRSDSANLTFRYCNDTWCLVKAVGYPYKTKTEIHAFYVHLYGYTLKHVY